MKHRLFVMVRVFYFVWLLVSFYLLGACSSGLKSNFNYGDNTEQVEVQTSPGNGAHLTALPSLQISFSKPVQGALNHGNYSISGAGAGNLQPVSVAQTGAQTYQVHFIGSVNPGLFFLHLNNISSPDAAPLSTSQISFNGDFISPTLVATSLVSGSNMQSLSAIDFHFSEQLTNYSSLANYSLDFTNGQGGGDLSLISFTHLGGVSYRAEFSGSPAFGELTFAMTNLQDAVGNLLPQTEGTMIYSFNYKLKNFVKGNNSKLAFGRLVAAANDTLAVSMGASEVVLFRRGGSSNWQPFQTIDLWAPVQSMAMTHDLLVMGNIAINEVYIYRRNHSSWQFEQKLLPTTVGFEFYGSSVAISENTIVVGAERDGPGSAYVYEYDGSIWQQQGYLTAPNSASGDAFGQKVAIDSDLIAVGAPGEDNLATSVQTSVSSNSGSPDSGAVYIFQRLAGAWQFSHYIKADNNHDGMGFGTGLDFNNGSLAIGAPKDNSDCSAITVTACAPGATLSAGSIAIYTFNGSTFSLQAFLKENLVKSNSEFGTNVILRGDWLLTGFANESSGDTFGVINAGDGSALGSTGTGIVGSGAAAIFRRVATSWQQTAFFKAPAIDAHDHFAAAIAFDKGSVFIGAPGEDSDSGSAEVTIPSLNADNSKVDSGAVYIFEKF